MEADLPFILVVDKTGTGNAKSSGFSADPFSIWGYSGTHRH